MDKNEVLEHLLHEIKGKGLSREQQNVTIACERGDEDWVASQAQAATIAEFDRAATVQAGHRSGDKVDFSYFAHNE